MLTKRSLVGIAIGLKSLRLVLVTLIYIEEERMVNIISKYQPILTNRTTLFTSTREKQQNLAQKKNFQLLLTVMSSTWGIVASPIHIDLLWSGCIGYVTAMMVTLILFCQLLYSFIKTFKSPDPDEPTKLKSTYILVMTYLISAFASCAVHSTLRTNILTAHNLNFTPFRCVSGFVLGYFFMTINYTVLSLIFLFRVYFSFKDSTYEYKPWIYRTFCIIILLYPVSTYSTALYNEFRAHFRFAVVHDPSTNLAFCMDDTIDDLPIFLAMFVALAQCVISIGLLSLFIRGLWLLNKEMMTSFMKEYDDPSPPESVKLSMHPVCSRSDTQTKLTHTTAVSTSTTSSTPSQIQEPHLNAPKAKTRSKRSVSVEKVCDVWHRQRTQTRNQLRPEVQRILSLHNLIKKQTILVCIATVSTILLWIGAAIYGAILLQGGWDTIVNSVCVWMMLDTSKRYWKICKKYGLCWCCYCTTNKMGM